MTKNEFAAFWALEPRQTPLVVAMTSARIESSFNEYARGAEVNGTSFGLFQFYSRYYPDAGTWSVLKQMEEYDKRMGSELKRRDVRDAFRKWNGAGKAAEDYADRCMDVLHTEFSTQVDVLPLSPLTLPGRSLSKLTIAGVIVAGVLFLTKK